jgi:hypothetical protein
VRPEALLVLTVLTAPLAAEPETTAPPAPAQETPEKPIPAPTQPPEPEPLREFTPSERIEADRSVDFPVDI